MHQNIHEVGQSITDLWETDKSREQCGLWERPETDFGQKDKRLSQWAIKHLMKVNQKQMWFDLLAARTPPEKIDQQETQRCFGQL